MALCTEVWIERRPDRAGRVGLDLGLCPEIAFDLRAQGPRVMGGIGDDMPDAFEAVDQRRGLRTVPALPRRRDQPQQQPEGIDGRVDPG